MLGSKQAETKLELWISLIEIAHRMSYIEGLWLQQTRTQRKGKEHCAFVLLLLVHTTTLYVPIATLLKRRTLAEKLHYKSFHEIS